ncbi:hypothetical protein RFI_29857 [Reticulomyxa filosa]|uniref:Uncharacterized protein n=1 Tax=Reticulomyxa filosa TaxID=46433 RepID=X6M3D4_RETFI|nr:hypothetical protein RFI_29857 [Reticulomyxa filosa]|eukprot:ETO07535.1 hypothetical protein RFI_29857 [Reticulomyxa filosa]
MKALLVLMVLHVSNVFVVLSNASERNTSNCSWTNRKKHFTQHSNMNILSISRDMLLNHLWKLETWKCEQSLQLYNNMSSASSLQISNNELMQPTNDSIRICQSTLVVDPKQSKKNWHSKASTISVFISTLTIRQTSYKRTFTAATSRYITVTKRLNGKKNEMILKKNSVLKNGKMESMISTQLSKRRCSGQERASIVDVVNDQLFRVQHWCKREFNRQHYLQPQQIYFFQSRCTMHASIKYKLAQGPIRPKHVAHNFAAILSIVQCCNCYFEVSLIKGQRILGIIVQPAAIAGTNCDGKHVVIISWHKHVFDVIDALLAQMRKVGDNAADEQVGRGAYPLVQIALYCQSLDLIMHLAINTIFGQTGQIAILCSSTH